MLQRVQRGFAQFASLRGLSWALVLFACSSNEQVWAGVFSYDAPSPVYTSGAPIKPNNPKLRADTFSIKPPLPPGLVIDTGTGAISGTPSAVSVNQTVTYTVMAVTEGRANSTATLRITITPPQAGGNAAPRPTALSYANVDVLYSTQVPISPNQPTVTGGVPTEYSINPALPSGLTLNVATGVISGTPTAVSPKKSYVVTAKNSSGSANATLQLGVQVSAPTSVSYSKPSALYSVGIAISANAPTVVGGVPTSYTISPNLPAGLNFNTSTGVISGTPGSASVKNTYKVTARNAAGSVFSNIEITVGAATCTVITKSCPANATYANRSFPDTVWSGNDSSKAACTKRAQEWFDYCKSLDPVSVQFKTSTEELTTVTSSSCLIKISRCPNEASRAQNPFMDANGSASASVCRQRGIDWSTYCKGAASDLVIASFTDPVGVKTSTDQRGRAIDPDNIPPAPQTLSYSSQDVVYPALRNITQNTPVVTGGAPTEFSVTPALPAGLNLNASTGVITGSPSTPIVGKQRFVVTASNGTGSTSATLLIGVSGPQPASCTVTVKSCKYEQYAYRTFPDNEWKGGDAQKSACQMRAQQWLDYCETFETPVVTFTSTAGEVTSYTGSSCKIKIQKTCVKDTSHALVFTDAYENSSTDAARCAKRASEWALWCGILPATGEVLATFTARDGRKTTTDSAGTSIAEVDIAPVPTREVSYCAIESGNLTPHGEAKISDFALNGVLVKGCDCPADLNWIPSADHTRFDCKPSNLKISETPTVPLSSFSLSADSLELKNATRLELALEGVAKGEVATAKAVTIKNTAAAKVDFEIKADPGLTLDVTETKFSLNANETTSFKLKLDASQSGVKSGVVTITNKTDASKGFTFMAGGIVWATTAESTDDTPVQPPRQNPKWRVWGSEIAALLAAKTQAQFEALLPDVTLNDSERKIVFQLSSGGDLEKKIATFIIACQKSAISKGAQAVAENLKSELRSAGSANVVAVMSRYVSVMAADENGRARALLLSIVSQIPGIELSLRAYSKMALKDGLIEGNVSLNAFGRFFLRAALFRVYLKTMPPLSEANPLAESLFDRVKNVTEKAPLLDAFASQYSEVLAKVRGVP